MEKKPKWRISLQVQMACKAPHSFPSLSLNEVVLSHIAIVFPWIFRPLVVFVSWKTFCPFILLLRSHDGLYAMDDVIGSTAFD